MDRSCRRDVTVPATSCSLTPTNRCGPERPDPAAGSGGVLGLGRRRHQEGAEMWTDEHRKAGYLALALRKARLREARLAERTEGAPGRMSGWHHYLSLCHGGASHDPRVHRRVDGLRRLRAVSIDDMAGFKEPITGRDALHNIHSAWHQSQPHPDTGTMIEFCWENPAAWKILAATSTGSGSWSR